ncbi:MAG: DNA-binding protein [Oscillospiraceae bacterium]|nr:DNA-binding protein [Oscillospiraceae bacterium]
MEDKTLMLTLMFDFFGELLPQKQREYFDLYYNEDMSLSEIAENAGISRQGVRDMIVRAEKALTEYEEKTGVVSRALETRRRVKELLEILDRAEEKSDGEVSRLIDEARRGLCSLKG